MPPYKTFSFMSGFLGCISRDECVNEVFYGTDYHSHLGTKRAGMAFVAKGKFMRSIHSLEDGYPLGRYAVVTVARIDNIEELTHELLAQGNHFAELSDSSINATELVAILIGQGKSLKEGIELVQRKVKGSCSMLRRNV